LPDPLARLGHRGIAFVGQLVAFSRLCWATVRAFFITYPSGRRVVARVGLMQIYFTGVQSVPVLSLIAVLWGIVVIVESATTLPALGAMNLMGRIFVVVVLRELGPLLTAFVIISRSGTAITAELASMVVHDEIAALKVMDIDVPRVIIAPRLVGAIVAAVCLTIYFVAVAVSSGYVVAYWFTGLPLDNFVQNLFDAISAKDLLVSLAKSVGFGMIVSLLSCYHGLSVRFSPTEIPQVVTRATVASLVWCFVYGSFLTVVSF
jgi:phospholipid/cholesterol/gamma-HCH transport system permease protein